jgi:hypothetical protein
MGSRVSISVSLQNIKSLPQTSLRSRSAPLIHDKRTRVEANDMKEEFVSGCGLFLSVICLNKNIRDCPSFAATFLCRIGYSRSVVCTRIEQSVTVNK